jgi:hypothetical protein
MRELTRRSGNWSVKPEEARQRRIEAVELRRSLGRRRRFAQVRRLRVDSFHGEGAGDELELLGFSSELGKASIGGATQRRRWFSEEEQREEMSKGKQDRASERVRNISTILIFISRRVAVKNGGARDVSLAWLRSARQRAASGRRQSTFLQKPPLGFLLIAPKQI